MKAIGRRIELAANVATIAVAALLALVISRQYLWGQSTVEGARSRPRVELQPGMKLPLEQVDWGKSDKTLVLVLSKQCHFCAESMPFYRRLSDALRDRSQARLIGVFPQQTGDGDKYLSDLKVAVDEVREVSLDAIKVPLTPALILVDHSGRVTNLWVGKQPADKESEILSAVTCSECQPGS